MTNTTPSAAWWKKLLVVGVASGAAFALVLCVAVGAILWFQSRPKPWNTEAVKASYATLEFLMDSDSFVVEFGYDLQNNTNRDYRIDNGHLVVEPHGGIHSVSWSSHAASVAAMASIARRAAGALPRFMKPCGMPATQR